MNYFDLRIQINHLVSPKFLIPRTQFDPLKALIVLHARIKTTSDRTITVRIKVNTTQKIDHNQSVSR